MPAPPGSSRAARVPSSGPAWDGGARRRSLPPPAAVGTFAEEVLAKLGGGRPEAPSATWPSSNF